MKWFDNIWNRIDEYFSSNEKEIIVGYESLLEIKDTQINDLIKAKQEIRDENFLLKGKVLQQEKTIKSLSFKLEEAETKIAEGSLKMYWDNKIKSYKSQFYNARGSSMNVIRFFHEENDKVPVLNGVDNDTKANNALRWVNKNVKYTSDKELHGKSEWWQYANETLELKKGDCEDGAILMANIMVASGVPDWRIRLNAGSVKGGGHAYVTYLREKDNQWYVLDWCYWYSESMLFRKKWTDAKKYFGIWFSWNTYAAYREPLLDRPS